MTEESRHSRDQRNSADQDASARHAELAGLQPAQIADGAALTKAIRCRQVVIRLRNRKAVQLKKCSKNAKAAIAHAARIGTLSHFGQRPRRY